MGTYLVVVMTNPRDGMEEEYLDHYEHTHLDDVLATTPFSSAQLFRLEEQRGANAAHGFMAVYETEADSAEDAIAQLEARRDERVQSPSINRRDAALWVFSPNGERHVRPPG
ncbi:MAG: hypothetical protein AAFN30_02535 [Actinomycetota bacterium]